MIFEETALPGVRYIRYAPHADDRGQFVDFYNKSDFHAAGISDEFRQHAAVRSTELFTVRGLHFQRPPFAQSKLIRVQTGTVLDVIVDLRSNQKTFGQHLTFEMSATDMVALYLPAGFAHGYCTLSKDTEIHYAIAGAYNPDHAGGVRWNDLELGIKWPVTHQDAILSDKDMALPMLSELPKIF